MNSRIPWIDALRVVAAFAVVWLHVSATIVLAQPHFESVDWWTGYFANTSVRWCVPVFLMISGSLLLPKAGCTSIIEFYKRRLARIAWPVAFWSAFFTAWTWIRHGQVDVRGAVEALLLGRPYPHLWFFFALLGLYAIAPFLAVFLSAATRKLVWGAVITAFAIFWLHNVVSVFRGWRPDVFVLWMPYVPYFLLGYLVIPTDRPLFSRRVAAWILVFSIIVIVLFTGLLIPILHEHSWKVMCSNLNPLVILSTICVVCIAHSSSGSLVDNALIHRITPLMLGVYAIHPVWIDVLDHIGVSAAQLPPAVGIPACSIAVFLLSLLSCWLIAWIPFARRLVT